MTAFIGNTRTLLRPYGIDLKNVPTHLKGIESEFTLFIAALEIFGGLLFALGQEFSGAYLLLLFIFPVRLKGALFRSTALGQS